MSVHKYRLFEIGIDKEHYDTGHIISCSEPEVDANGHCCNECDTVDQIWKLYGFTEYKTYYRYRKAPPNDFSITYNYGGSDGHQPTWFLKRGD
jgi:hypothetical protein